MSARRSRRVARLGLVVGIAAGALALLRPWTIVPIETAGPRAFDADGYVASLWDERVLPAARESAVDLQAFMQDDAVAGPDGNRSTRAVFVKGTAVVAEVDRTSRVGLARLRLPWATDGRAASLQVGPVLRGTAVRDALAFIRFTDFVNQLEFAAVANALNQRVMTHVVGAVDLDALAGREVSFVGAVATSSPGAALEIVPVELQVAGGTS